mgnify:CR=1 FL=1
MISNLVEGAFTQDDEFTAEKGFFLAAALTEYDSVTESIEFHLLKRASIPSESFESKHGLAKVLKPTNKTNDLSGTFFGITVPYLRL